MIQLTYPLVISRLKYQIELVNQMMFVTLFLEKKKDPLLHDMLFWFGQLSIKVEFKLT